jgi:hypothetical protein
LISGYLSGLGNSIESQSPAETVKELLACLGFCVRPRMDAARAGDAHRPFALLVAERISFGLCMPRLATGVWSLRLASFHMLNAIAKGFGSGSTLVNDEGVASCADQIIRSPAAAAINTSGGLQCGMETRESC